MPTLTPALRKVECHPLKVGCKMQVRPYPAGMADIDTTALAVAAATSGTDRRVLLVPQVEGRMAHVGVIAMVENAGELPGGGSAAIIRGLQRARLGAGVVAER